MSGKPTSKRRRKSSFSGHANVNQRRRHAEHMTRQRQSQVCQAQQLSLPLAFLYFLQLSNLTLLQGSASHSVASNTSSAAPQSSAASCSVAWGTGPDDGSGSEGDSSCSDDPAAAQRPAHKPWCTHNSGADASSHAQVILSFSIRFSHCSPSYIPPSSLFMALATPRCCRALEPPPQRTAACSVEQL